MYTHREAYREVYYLQTGTREAYKEVYHQGIPREAYKEVYHQGIPRVCEGVPTWVYLRV